MQRDRTWLVLQVLEVNVHILITEVKGRLLSLCSLWTIPQKASNEYFVTKKRVYIICLDLERYLAYIPTFLNVFHFRDVRIK